MNIQMHRLDPNVPDPVESRRSYAGRIVRIIYATALLGVLGFFIVRFGAPLVVLSGPGLVSAPRELVSLPYIVQVHHMEVTPGAKVQAGAPVALVGSPQVDETLSNFARALADLTSQEAAMRVKARVAQDTIDTARSRLRVADDSLSRLESSPSVESLGLTYRAEVYRERAQAQQNVAALEAEAAEASTQLVQLSQTRRQIQVQMDRIQKQFDGGRVFSPVAGIVSTHLARDGETVVAGMSIAEIFQEGDVYIDWYIPNFRFIDPQPGYDVFVVLGKTRARGIINEILPLSDTFRGQQTSMLTGPPTGQVARIRLEPGAPVPALNSTVQVHMYYLSLADRIAQLVVSLFGLGRA